MKTRYSGFTLTMLVAVMAVVSSAAAQQSPSSQQLAGTWKLVSVVVERDGNKTDTFGPNPLGLTMFDRGGHFARVETRSDLPKIASNNREKGTPEENQAIVSGSIAYAGTYSCNAAAKNCTFHVETATFPNWVGADQKRVLTISGDELRETNPEASTEGKAVLTWKRVR